MSNVNPTMNNLLQGIGALLSNLTAQAAQSQSPVEDGCVRLTYGTESVEVDASAYPNVASAFAGEANVLGLDTSRAATYTKDGTVISGNAGLTEGAVYVASVKHDDKG